METLEFFKQFIGELKEAFKSPYSGEAAHQDMEALSAGYLNSMPNADTKKSAVLFLLYPYQQEVFFPLILRSRYDGFHSSEIGFPGGRYEATDRDLIHTALRETREEIGINSKEIKVLGVLTEVFIAPSNFMVLPVVAYIPYKPEFLPDAREVNRIFEVNLHHFLQPNAIILSEIQLPGDLVLTPHFQIEGYKIWGATAKIIKEFLLISNQG